MMLAYDKLSVIYSLFNQYLFPEAKSNLHHLERYFKNDAFALQNTLINRLIGLIRKYNYEDITDATFGLELMSDGKTADESQAIIAKIGQFRSYNKDQISIFRDKFKELCFGGYIQDLKYKYESDPVKFVEECQKFQYISNYSSKLQVKTFGQLNIDDLAEEYKSGGIKSSFDFINRNSPIGAYIPGQIVQIVGAPGTGKSLFLQQEAVNMVKAGRKVHYMALGDLDELDVVIRMCAQYCGKSIREVSNNIKLYYDKCKDIFADRLQITVVPSGQITIEEYVDFARAALTDTEVLLIDYDSNFKHSNESMYLDGGAIYDSLTILTRELRKLVIIASQPQRSYFREEIIPADGSGESSRKYHISDMVITIGRNQNSKLRMGVFNLGKNRRGELDMQKWIACDDGTFFECTDLLYARYRSNQLIKTVSKESLYAEEIQFSAEFNADIANVENKVA